MRTVLMMMLIIAVRPRGPGVLSLDHLIATRNNTHRS